MTVGQKLSLGVGVAALAGAGVIGIAYREPFGALLVAIVGASALSGFVKSRRPR